MVWLQKGRTALLSAVHARNIPCTNLLLDRRADTNVIDAVSWNNFNFMFIFSL